MSLQDTPATASTGSSCSGTSSIDCSGLTQAGASASTTVYFRADQSAAFSTPPQVVATLMGAVPYALSVGSIDTAKFVLTVVAVSPPVTTVAVVSVNWNAFSHSR